MHVHEYGRECSWRVNGWRVIILLNKLLLVLETRLQLLLAFFTCRKLNSQPLLVEELKSVG